MTHAYVGHDSFIWVTLFMHTFDMLNIQPSCGVCCSILRCIAVCCGMLQHVQRVTACCGLLQHFVVCCGVLQFVAACAVCCSMLQMQPYCGYVGLDKAQTDLPRDENIYDAAAHCNALHRSAPHCTALQHTATHFN